MDRAQFCTFCASAEPARPFADDVKLAWRYWLCDACGFVFRDPSTFPSPSEERGHYDRHDNSDAPGYRAFLEPAAAAVSGLALAGASGLDYGCGPSPVLAKMLGERGYTMQVYDPYYAAEPEPAAGAFDFVVCTEAAEHFYRPREEFARLRACLRSGGALILMTRLREADDPAAFLDWFYRRDVTHVGFFSRRTLELWAGRAGASSVGFPAAAVCVVRFP